MSIEHEQHGGKTIYDLIEQERRERRADIGEIHNRIDQILDAINNIGKAQGQASWVRQSIGLTIAVIALVGFLVPTMVSIVKPMQQQIDYIEKHTSNHEDTAGHLQAISDIFSLKERILSLNEKTNIQISHIEKRMTEINADHKIFVSAEIEDIQRQLQDMRAIVDAKAADRFTGAEGVMMQKQIDRLEERLTFLTKQAMLSGSSPE